MTTAFAKIEPSLKEQAKRIERSRLRFAARELGETSYRTREIETWIDALSPLEQENAALLLQQQVIDGRAAERALDYEDLLPPEDPEEIHGFLQPVHFDRADDIWLFRAARSKTHGWRNRGQ